MGALADCALTRASHQTATGHRPAVPTGPPLAFRPLRRQVPLLRLSRAGAHRLTCRGPYFRRRFDRRNAGLSVFICQTSAARRITDCAEGMCSPVPDDLIAFVPSVVIGHHRSLPAERARSACQADPLTPLSDSPSDTPSGLHDGVVMRLAGREREVAALERALERARFGEGASPRSPVSPAAARRHWLGSLGWPRRSVVSRCCGPVVSSLVLLYWPWLQVLRARAEQVGDAALRVEAGWGAAELVQR